MFDFDSALCYTELVKLSKQRSLNVKKTLTNLYPAKAWNEATPLGNGKIGASVYGCRYDERILINHEMLFNYAKGVAYPDVSYALPIVRELMDQGKYSEAETYYTREIQKSGFKSEKGKYYPALDIHMIFEEENDFTGYERVLDMENGVCTVSYTEGNSACKREFFVSGSDGVVVGKITKQSPFDLKLKLERHDLADCFGGYYRDDIKTFANGEYVYFDNETEGHLHYSALLKIISTNGKIAQGNDTARQIDMSGAGALSDYLKIEGATEICFIMSVEHLSTPYEEMKSELDRVSTDYNELYSRHVSKFSALFNKTRLSIAKGEDLSVEELMLKSYAGEVDTRLTEKMADFGRYLLISSSVDCECPANLQGIWNGEYSPAWCSTYFNNENIQMAYWQACQGGLSEALLPLFNLYEKYMDDYRENAANLFGCRGILLPLFMDNTNGKKDNLQPHVLYWTGSSAWISAIYYDYYLFTGDKDFLRNRAYPFMKESMLFYEDFLVYDENGMLKSYPADSPENRPNGSFEGAGRISVCINPTMDFALIKELLTNLVSTASELNIDTDCVQKWQKMLSKIPAYEINEDGALKEWLHDDFKDNYHHRHQSHIYPLFPGFEIDEESAELYEAARVAVEKRLVIGLKEQTGWSLAHMANIFARLGDASGAQRCLDLLLRFCTGANLYTYHNDWRNMGVTLKFIHGDKPPFQIDANMGFAAAVYEMLLFSTPKKIKLLPALPSKWESGSLLGIMTRCGVKADVTWSKDGVCATLEALRDTSFKLKVKDKEYERITLKKGEKYVI